MDPVLDAGADSSVLERPGRSVADRMCWGLSRVVLPALNGAMAGVVFLQVVLRYLFNAPLSWSGSGPEPARHRPRPLRRGLHPQPAHRLLTPPFGASMFLVVRIGHTTMKAFIVEGWPFILALVVLLFLLTYFPAIVLLLPRHLG